MSQTESGSTALTSEQCDCVVEATSSTLEWLAGERPEYQGETTVEHALPFEGIIGCISLVGDIEWSLVISMPQDTAVPLATSFAGFEVPFDSPDMGDALGEIANLIAGELKVHLDGIGISADISLPQVFRGEMIEVLQLPYVPSVLLSFGATHGSFWVAIARSQ